MITIQSGHFLYVTSTNAFNAFGTNETEGDFAELAPNCTNSQVGSRGSVTSKLNNYFNTSCFAAYPVIGADGLATGFGNSRPGIIRGPAQNNVDFALIKLFPFSWHSKGTNLEFRAEAFNAFNTPEFNDPSLSQDQSNFGVINTSTVSPRIMQLALKLSF